MGNTVVIDLGEDWSAPGDERPARREWHAPRRGHIAAVLALLSVVVLGAAEPVPPLLVPLNPLARISVTEVAVIALGPDTLLVADRTPLGGGRVQQGELTAYSLSGGKPRWRRTLPQIADGLVVSANARVVFTVTHDGQTGSGLVSALDADDGRPLWSARSVNIVQTAVNDPYGLLVLDNLNADETVEWADLRTGRSQWSRPVPRHGALQVLPGRSPAEPLRLLLSEPGGSSQLVDGPTGAVLGSGRLDILDPADGRSGGVIGGYSQAQAIIVDGQIIVLHQGGGIEPGRLVAFDLATFTQRWTLIQRGDRFLETCARMICLAGDALTVLDPATGAVVWRSEQWQAAATVDPDRLFVSDYRNDGGAALVDAGSGRPLIPADGWTPLYSLASGKVRLLVRIDTRPVPGFWYASLDTAHDTIRTLGFVPRAIFEGCQTTEELFACQTQRGTIQVWRYRPP